MMDRKLALLALVGLVALAATVSAVSLDVEGLRSRRARLADDSLLLAPAQKKAPEQKKKAPDAKKKGDVAKKATKLPPGTFLEKQKGMNCRRVTLPKKVCVKPGKKVCKQTKKCTKYGELQRVCSRKCLHYETLPATTCHTTKKNVCKKWHKKLKKTFKCLKWAEHKKEDLKEKKECAKWVFKPSNARDCKKRGKGTAVSCKTFDRTPVCAKWKKRSSGKHAHKKYCAKMKTVKKKVCAHVKKITKKICKHISKKNQGKKFCAVRDKALTCRAFKKCEKHKKVKTCSHGCAKETATVFKCEKVDKKKTGDKKPAPGKVLSHHEQKKKLMASKCQEHWDRCRASGKHHASCYRDPTIAKFCGYKGVSAKCKYYGFKCRWGNSDEKKKNCPKAKECGEPTVSNNVLEYAKNGFAIWTKTCKTGVDTCKHNNPGKDVAWCLKHKSKVASACKKAKEYKAKLEKLQQKAAKGGAKKGAAKK